MRKSLPFFLLLLFTLFGLLSACQDTDDVNATPTPFTTAIATPVTTSTNPIPVTIEDLAANPAFYKDAHLKVTGLYRRLPRLICKDQAYPSPVTWGLVTGDLLAQAAGFDDQLRYLAPEQLFMTVIGTWQQWRGPIGCGKDAKMQNVWYLQISRIVSPSPLTRVTLTPDGGPIASANTPTPENSDDSALSGTPGAAPTETAVIPDSDSSPTPDESEANDVLETSTPSAADLTVTPGNTTPVESSLTPTPLFSSGTATVTPNGSATPTNANTTTTPIATATVTNTPPPGSTATTTVTPLPSLATPTPSPTPAASATPGTTSYTTVDQGTTDTEDIQIGTLGQNEAHSWGFSLDSSYQVYIYAAGELDADMEILLLNDAGTVIKEMNATGTGQIEIISQELLTAAGDYDIIVRTTNGASTEYSVVFIQTEDASDYQMVVRGYIDFGQTKSDTFIENSDHLWIFFAETGDVVNITVTGGDNTTDLLFELFNLTDFIDENVPNGGPDVEVLSNYTLTTTGMFIIWVGEANYEAGSYQLNLTIN